MPLMPYALLKAHAVGISIKRMQNIVMAVGITTSPLAHQTRQHHRHAHNHITPQHDI